MTMTIENLDEVQPVDDHVKGLLRIARDGFGVKVDPENATRRQRIRAAIAFEDSSGASSVEIMAGMKLDGHTKANCLVPQMEYDELGRHDPIDHYSRLEHRYEP